MGTIQEMEANYIINTYNRQPGSTPCLVRGKGSYLWDDQDKKYLDFLSGLAVNVVGHCHPEVVAAICKQAGILSHTSNLYYTGPQALLAKELVEKSLPGGKTFFANSGAEANEAAIKLVRKYRPGRYKVITAERSFHGRTMAALTATGQKKYQQAFNPLLEGFSYATFNDLDSFEALVDDQTAAIMIEPIQGEGGVHVAEPDFIEGLRHLCDRLDLLLVFDEVQCGMGRTGKLWAFENFKVKPDLLTAAKGLGGGLPIGALLTAENCKNLFVPGDHASTFGGNPVVCAAALAVMEIIHREGFMEEVVLKGQQLKEELEASCSSGQFRGLGLICALELKQPAAKAVQEKCTENGLLINAIGENTLRLLPPLNISDEELNEGLAIIKKLLQEI
ncbi:MAG: aspartate aminotransferase family protein [Bacillota bacterium]|nr:aspartate aminotransferase family protein [Bacillota bacterium]